MLDDPFFGLDCFRQEIIMRKRMRAAKRKFCDGWFYTGGWIIPPWFYAVLGWYR
jgi:hypothetical protein